MPNSSPRLTITRSAWIALVCAIAAFVCVLVAARGPAHRELAQVSWPANDAAAQPLTVDPAEKLWYTPLLVSSQTADSLAVTLPCELGSPSNPALIFATARRPADVFALAMTLRGATLEVTIGTDRLASVPWPANENCIARFHVDDFGWQLSRGDAIVASGVVFPPTVSGFYTEIDPASASGVRAELTTRPFGSRPSTRQWVFDAAAVVFGVLALSVLWTRRTTRAVARVGWPTRRVEDVVVVGALAVWWIVGPWFYDDGWLMATVRSHTTTGSFNNFFDTWAAQLPLGFVHHMILMPFAELGAPFLVWRIVPLVACIGTWILLRRAYSMVIGDDGARSGRVALTAAFLTFCFGWLMTLRPEPIVAFLSAAAGVACLHYARSYSRRALIVAVAAAAVAATLHPSGVVAGAALVVVLPTLVRDGRRSLAHAVEITTVMLIGMALALGLLFADTDIELWRRNRSLFATDGFHSRGIFDELMRYRDLLTNGTVPEVASVLFGALALGLFVTMLVVRRGRVRRLDAAGFALLSAGALLTITPSKWTYHFGSAAAIASFAIAVETARLAGAGSLDEQSEPMPRRDHRLRAWPLGAVVIAVGLVVGRSLASKADAQYFMKLSTPHINSLLARVSMVVVAVGVLVFARFAHDRERARAAIAQWVIPVGLLVAATTSVILLVVAPIIDGPPWSIARRGVPDALGDGCSVGDHIDVSDPRQLQTLTPIGSPSGDLDLSDGRPVHPPLQELADVPVYATDIAGWGATGTLWTPWFQVPATADDRDVVLALAGRTNHDGNEFTAEWARHDNVEQPLGRTQIRIDRASGQRNGDYWMDWRIVRLSRIAPAPAGADLVRFVARDQGQGVDDYIAFSAPFTVPHARLSTYIDHRTVLVSPPQLPVLACTTAPYLDDGLAAMPDVTIGFLYDRSVSEIAEIGNLSGPWHLADDAYRVRRVWAWLSDTDAVMVMLHDDMPDTGRVVAPTIRHIRT